MKKFPKLSLLDLKCIDKLDKIQHSAEYDDFNKHVQYIAAYCFKNNLKTLSFKRRKGQAWSGDCSFYNYLEFMTPARRKDVKKQMEEMLKV